MQDQVVVPSVSDDFQFSGNSEGSVEVQYLDSGLPATNQPVVDTVNTVPVYTDSQFNPTVVALESLDLMDLIQMFVVYAFIIAAALSAIFIFVGGISFILSGGNDEKIKQAVNTIRYSIIGLIITILSFTVVTILGRMFGLNFMEYLSYGQIKNSINQLISGTSAPSNSFEIQD
jgi:hypothetical protein